MSGPSEHHTMSSPPMEKPPVDKNGRPTGDLFYEDPEDTNRPPSMRPQPPVSHQSYDNVNHPNESYDLHGYGGSSPSSHHRQQQQQPGYGPPGSEGYSSYYDKQPVRAAPQSQNYNYNYDRPNQGAVPHPAHGSYYPNHNNNNNDNNPAYYNSNEGGHPPAGYPPVAPYNGGDNGNGRGTPQPGYNPQIDYNHHHQHHHQHQSMYNQYPHYDDSRYPQGNPDNYPPHPPSHERNDPRYGGPSYDPHNYNQNNYQDPYYKPHPPPSHHGYPEGGPPPPPPNNNYYETHPPSGYRPEDGGPTGYGDQPQFGPGPPPMAGGSQGYPPSGPPEGYPSANPSQPLSTETNSAILPGTEGMPLEQRIDLYRQNAKRSTDPKVQLDFAKYLIDIVPEAVEQNPDPKATQKVKEALYSEALKWIKRLSSQGMGLGRSAYPEAQFFLANCYGNGNLGLSCDMDKAFGLYVQASKQNHAAATYRAAVCYELGAGTKRDPARSVQFYRKAAALGEKAAMYKLGVIQLNGLLNQQKNPREAITWLKRAAAVADEENPHALHELGLCYEKNTIPAIIPDESYSRELFTKAAQLGYAPSQFKLGCCYEYGTLTCPVDPRRSIAWYTRAAEQGDAEAELALSGWYLTGSDNVLKQSDTEAYLWARKAADKGLAKAEYAVGYYSEVGIGVKQDIEEARRWYLRASAQGNKRAMQRLTELKKLGAGAAHRRPGGPTKPTRGAGGPKDDNCCIS